MEQSRERSSTLPLHFGVVANENMTFDSPSTTIGQQSNLYMRNQLISTLKKGKWYAVHTGLMSRIFANDSGGWGSIPGRVIPKTPKNGTVLLNTQHYKLRIKG